MTTAGPNVLCKVEITEAEWEYAARGGGLKPMRHKAIDPVGWYVKCKHTTHQTCKKNEILLICTI